MKNKKVKLLAAAFLLMGSIAVSNTEVQAAQWNVNDYGWWYQEDDGSYPAIRGSQLMESGTILTETDIC